MREGIKSFDKNSETTVISAILLGDDTALEATQAILGDGSAFRIKLHELVYDAVMALWETDTPIDPSNIANLIDVSRIGMSLDQIFAWVLDWVQIADVWSIDVIKYHAQRVADMAELRNIDQRLRRILMENMSDNADLENVYEQLESVLSKHRQPESAEVISVQQARERYIQYVAEIQQRKIKFGWPDVDNATRGLIPGDVCLIYARTNVGKSALAQSMQLSIWERQQVRSIFFSMEMIVESVYERMASMVTGWSEEDIEKIFLDNDHDRLVDLSGYDDGVLFVDRGGLTLAEIGRITRSADDIGIIFIDYMQLVKGNGSTSYERLSNTARALKDLAKELGIAVVCLCQLSRKGGDGTVPVQLDMARDSGQIEEATDVILGLHKDEESGSLKLSVLKARRGRNGVTCSMGFYADTPKIVQIHEGGESCQNV